MMNFVVFRRLVSLLMYCGVVVLVIVNGQSTPGGVIGKDESSRLVDIVAELRAELVSTKDQLATTVDRIARLEGENVAGK